MLILLRAFAILLILGSHGTSAYKMRISPGKTDCFTAVSYTHLTLPTNREV